MHNNHCANPLQITLKSSPSHLLFLSSLSTSSSSLLSASPSAAHPVARCRSRSKILQTSRKNRLFCRSRSKIQQTSRKNRLFCRSRSRIQQVSLISALAPPDAEPIPPPACYPLGLLPPAGRKDRTGAGAQRRLLLLEPMAARGRMSGRGPQAKRSGRDEQSKTAKGSGNNSLLCAPGREGGRGRRVRGGGERGRRARRSRAGAPGREGGRGSRARRSRAGAPGREGGEGTRGGGRPGGIRPGGVRRGGVRPRGGG